MKKTIEEVVNYGIFYTPNEFIDIVWNMILPYVKPDTTVLDSSCGKIDFFKSRFDVPCMRKGNDIDINIINEMNILYSNAITLYNKNALFNVSRDVFDIKDNEKLIIIGNPPYNDRTSLVKYNIKDFKVSIDQDIIKNDMGMSFLL